VFFLRFITLAKRPCELVCGTVSSAYYFGKVLDSTPCAPGKKGSVCIQGECKVSSKKTVWRSAFLLIRHSNSALKIQYHVVKNTLLHSYIAFSAILPNGLYAVFLRDESDWFITCLIFRIFGYKNSADASSNISFSQTRDVNSLLSNAKVINVDGSNPTKL